MNNTKTIANDLVKNIQQMQVTIFRLLVGGIIILSIIYIYMIGSITFNVVARKSLENTTRILASNISQLELTYLTNMNDINKSRATSLGFVDTNINIFAIRSINHVAIR